MANVHFAEIGDVWKHLPLAEALAIDRSCTCACCAGWPQPPRGGRYPGSAYIAMAVLGPATGEYRLADTDPISVADLRKTAARLAGPDRVEVVEGDGVAALLEAFSRLEPTAAAIGAAVDRHGVQGRLWAGEITVAGFGAHPPAWDPGVPGCGIVCANLSDQATAACEELGTALRSIYANAVLPNGDDGSLDFRTLMPW
jgi:hypothetical protein